MDLPIEIDADEITETTIRHHAYVLWLSEGQPDGRADAHWRSAAAALAAQDEAAEATPHDGDQS